MLVAGYFLIVLKFVSSSSASESSSDRHASELKNRARRDLTYQNRLGNHLSTHHTTKLNRNSSYGSNTGMNHSVCFILWILLSDFSMAKFQAIRAQEEIATRIAMEEAKKARREAKQKAMLARISQLKRVCICRMYCRGENIIFWSIWPEKNQKITFS